MERHNENAKSIACAIRHAESLNDELMTAMADLKKRMIAARCHPDIAPHTGQHALIHLAAAEQALLKTSNELARTHGRLSELAVTMNVEHPPTDMPFTTAETQPELRVSSDHSPA